MALSAGDTLGPYQILAPIGEGGMGAVYKARDTRLDRVVALKVSHEQFNARFEREAKVISALNHPHICTLFDVGPNYLVMEFVEGKPLLTPDRPGPLPREEAFRWAIQIADALDHAHRAGVVHRDLKPANILIGKNGVKVLDFGLAKLSEQSRDRKGADAATVTMALTQVGAIMGTPQYMAPEQAEGQEADARSDIFAFGAILYEMLTGRRAFDGKSAASILASVLREQPQLDPGAAGSLDPVVKRCLEKDPDRRFQTAADLRWALEQAQTARPASSAAIEAPAALAAAPKKPTWIPWVAAIGSLAVAIGMWFWLHRPEEPPQSLKFYIDSPKEVRFGAIYFSTALSPDGRYLVFGAVTGTETSLHLWLRPMDSLDAHELPGTDNGNGVFWSPDSKSIGFVGGDGKLKRIDISGGPAQILCDAPDFGGASWDEDGGILFSSGGVLKRVPASSGTATPVTDLDTAHKEARHDNPFWLPGGKTFLFTILSTDPGVEGIYASSVDQPKQRTKLAPGNAKALYAPPHAGSPGQLLWLREQALVAQPFDASKLKTLGDPVVVADNIAATTQHDSRAAFWISDNGLLTYRLGSNGYFLNWVSRDGKVEEIPGAGADIKRGDPKLSPDGTRVALNRDVSNAPGAGNFDIWIYEFARGVFTRVTFDPADDTNPVWSPDGKQIAFQRSQNGVAQIYRKDSSGAGTEEQLTNDSFPKAPIDWSRDGQHLLYEQRDPKGVVSIWDLPMRGDRKPVPVLQSSFNQVQPQLSPDGKWIAYATDESGTGAEVFIQPFPPTGAKWQVSPNGGLEPRWRGDGKELYYFTAGAIWAAPVQASGGHVQIGTVEKLFPTIRLPIPTYFYDVAADGKRFFVIQPAANRDYTLTVVSNWQSVLKK